MCRVVDCAIIVVACNEGLHALASRCVGNKTTFTQAGGNILDRLKRFRLHYTDKLFEYSKIELKPELYNLISNRHH